MLKFTFDLVFCQVKSLDLRPTNKNKLLHSKARSSPETLEAGDLVARVCDQFQMRSN